MWIILLELSELERVLSIKPCRVIFLYISTNDNAVRFVPSSFVIFIYTYAHVLYFLVPFSRYDIFTPFRKHVTSWLSWYRSAGKKEHAATCAFVFTMAHRRPWPVDWRRFACKRKTFHLPRWPVGGGGKFSRTTDAGPPLIALIPILHSFLPL